MSVQIAVTDARAQLPALLDRVASGEEITLTRHGQAAAVLVHPHVLRRRRRADLDDRRKRQDDIWDQAKKPTAGTSAPWPEGYADELVASIREGRDAR